MRLIQHKSNNDVLKAPPGVPNEQVRPAPITRLQYPDGSYAVATFWQPSPLELEAIARGEPVCVVVQGITMPPIFVSTHYE